MYLCRQFCSKGTRLSPRLPRPSAASALGLASPRPCASCAFVMTDTISEGHQAPSKSEKPAKFVKVVVCPISPKICQNCTAGLAPRCARQLRGKPPTSQTDGGPWSRAWSASASRSSSLGGKKIPSESSRASVDFCELGVSLANYIE